MGSRGGPSDRATSIYLHGALGRAFIATPRARRAEFPVHLLEVLFKGLVFLTLVLFILVRRIEPIESHGRERVLYISTYTYIYRHYTRYTLPLSIIYSYILYLLYPRVFAMFSIIGVVKTGRLEIHVE